MRVHAELDAFLVSRWQGPVDPPANFVQRAQQSAGSAARYSITVGAGMRQAYHEDFWGNCNVSDTRGSAKGERASTELDADYASAAAIRDSRIASNLARWLTNCYARIAFSIAAEARPCGSARSCSHSCRVRFEICRRNAASLCERSFFSRHARSRSASFSVPDVRCRVCCGCAPELIGRMLYVTHL